MVPSRHRMMMLNTADNIAGMEIVVAGWAGAAGTAVWAKRSFDILSGIFPPGYLRRMTGAESLMLTEEQISVTESCGADYRIEVGTLGIYKGLWDISGSYGLGFEIDGYSIPFRQETIELCEALGLDAYRIDSTGSLLLLGFDGYGIKEKLISSGIHASLIGHLISANDKLIRFGDRTTYLMRPDAQRKPVIFP